MSKPAAKGGFEQDVFSKWARRYYCCFQRAGVAKSSKQMYNRRLRRDQRMRNRQSDKEG